MGGALSYEKGTPVGRARLGNRFPGCVRLYLGYYGNVSSEGAPPRGNKCWYLGSKGT